LWQLNQKQLSRVLFPVGGYTKPEVRKLAKEFNLPTAETPESQEVCFVQDTTNNFLKKYIKNPPAGGPGKIVDVVGNILGEHHGLWFYTIGQRKALEIQQGPAYAKASAGKPLYVVEKNFKKNILVVSKNKKDLLKKELIAKNVNWISGKKPKLPTKAVVKIRYRNNPTNALICTNKGGVKVVFTKPQQAITPGQSVVFYSGKELIGGGVIK
jgi:tRNA-specific 2-thiouridylase